MASEIRVDTINPTVGINTVTFPTNVSVGDTIFTNNIIAVGSTLQTYWSGITTNTLYLNNTVAISDSQPLPGSSVLVHSVSVGRTNSGAGYGSVIAINSPTGEASTININQFGNAAYKFEIPAENKQGSNLILSRYVSPSATHPSGQLWNDYVTFGYDGNVGIGTTIVTDTYSHGGTNRAVQIFNPGTSSNSQAHILIGSGADSQTYSSMGSISWGLPTAAAANKGLAYIGGVTGAASTSGTPSSYLAFGTRNTTDSTFLPRMYLTETGYLRLVSSGIQFNNDTAAANALNDYEEGTWTPSLPNGGTLSVYRASYTKIGRVVHAYVYLSALSPTNNASSLLIGGLPYAATSVANEYGFGVVLYQGSSTINVSGWRPSVSPSSTSIYFTTVSGNNANALTNGAWAAAASGQPFMCNVTYIV